MKNFPKIVYILRNVPDDEGSEKYYTYDDKEVAIMDEEENTEVAVYQLVKVGSVKHSTKIVFDE